MLRVARVRACTDYIDYSGGGFRDESGLRCNYDESGVCQGSERKIAFGRLLVVEKFVLSEIVTIIYSLGD